MREREREKRRGEELEGEGREERARERERRRQECTVRTNGVITAAEPGISNDGRHVLASWPWMRDKNSIPLVQMSVFS